MFLPIHRELAVCSVRRPAVVNATTYSYLPIFFPGSCCVEIRTMSLARGFRPAKYMHWYDGDHHNRLDRDLRVETRHQSRPSFLPISCEATS